MNDIELLAHKISTIMLILNNNHPISKIDGILSQRTGGSLYLTLTEVIARNYIDIEIENSDASGKVDVGALISSNPVSASPLTKGVSTGFEGYLWYNTNDDYFIYQHSNTNYDEDKFQFIDPYDEAEVFQKSLITKPHEMMYLMLFSTMHLNPLIKGLKFYIQLNLVHVVYDLLMQGYSYEV
ncbi:hypothetical protein PBI_121Q_349 [Escherichia phage 121Q]|uniref:Uncharacterized protein n=1 Tax=Escherichia phage 121Q TaxID=1555202 RepID=A0A097EXR0_9CAUD|nr:hypothetical protein PBI_121Q_349 [Escherichia phage 121Q]AIT14239.1 hypothetical protein PBI_121Q_349 [Escherichia phage 121Q]